MTKIKKMTEMKIAVDLVQVRMCVFLTRLIFVYLILTLSIDDARGVAGEPSI